MIWHEAGGCGTGAGDRSPAPGTTIVGGDDQGFAKAGRRSQMVVAAGTVNAVVCGVRAPAVERGKTISVTAYPAAAVPGKASMSSLPPEPAVEKGT